MGRVHAVLGMNATKVMAGGVWVDQRLMGIAEAVRRSLNGSAAFRGRVYRYLYKAPHLTYAEMLERAVAFDDAIPGMTTRSVIPMAVITTKKPIPACSDLRGHEWHTAKRVESDGTHFKQNCIHCHTGRTAIVRS